MAQDINNVKIIFYNTFKTNLILNKDELTKEKHLGLGSYNKCDLISLCQKISNEHIVVKINTIDIFYEYVNKHNKKENREEKVIIITSELMKQKLSDENLDNYFLDITCKVIPKNFKGYKLMTITSLDKISKNSFIAALILLKYEDYNSFVKIFKYLNEMYNFNPKVIHIDYSNALRKALLTENIFKNTPIIIHCFFHFVQSIVKHMKLYGLIKNKITKYSFEILKNIELLCFISPGYIKSFSKFLKNKLKNEKETLLYNYIDKQWLSKDPNYYNYFELFNNEYLNEGIQHFYSTNNIEESLHNKLSLYIPNKKVTNFNFIISLRNVISNYETLKENITRHDYITKSLIFYCKSIKKNNYNWLTYEEFKNIEKK